MVPFIWPPQLEAIVTLCPLTMASLTSSAVLTLETVRHRWFVAALMKTGSIPCGVEYFFSTAPP